MAFWALNVFIAASTLVGTSLRAHILSEYPVPNLCDLQQLLLVKTYMILSQVGQPIVYATSTIPQTFRCHTVYRFHIHKLQQLFWYFPNSTWQWAVKALFLTFLNQSKRLQKRFYKQTKIVYRAVDDKSLDKKSLY